MKAMIFAAGKGTRLGKLTNDKPKALVRIHNVTVLENAIRTLVKYGFDRIIINVFHFADQVINFLDDNKQFGLNIEISDEREELLDTGGGLRKASWFLDGTEPFLLYNVDVLTDMDLSLLYKSHINSEALATLAVRHRKTARYLMIDKYKKLYGWKNVETGEQILSGNVNEEHELVAFSGIQVVSPEIFKVLPDKTAFPIMSAYLDLARTHTINTFEHDDSRWLDIGRPESLKTAEELFPNLKN